MSKNTKTEISLYLNTFTSRINSFDTKIFSIPRWAIKATSIRTFILRKFYIIQSGFGTLNNFNLELLFTNTPYLIFIRNCIMRTYETLHITVRYTRNTDWILATLFPFRIFLHEESPTTWRFFDCLFFFWEIFAFREI